MCRCAILALWISTVSAIASCQVAVRTFEGIRAQQVSQPGYDVDPNGAVGTKQYVEWVNAAYQAYDKKTGSAVYASPRSGNVPFQGGLPQCQGNEGDGVILFDHLASRWILARRFGVSSFLYCIAVSTGDDITARSFSWRAYSLLLDPFLGRNSKGHLLVPDYPKIGTWPDAYYATFNLLDPDRFFRAVGVLVCAFDRERMLTGAGPRAPQCFRYPDNPNAVFQGHSLLPADVDGTEAPPSGNEEAFISIELPGSKQSQILNWWTFHLDWTMPAKSRFSGPQQVRVNSYTPGCYTEKNPADTTCVPQPSTGVTRDYLDSVGDRLMHRFAYRRYQHPRERESYLVAHTVQIGNGEHSPTGIRWYELDGRGQMVASGTIGGQDANYRFMPSMAQDKVGDAAVGYSISGTTLHPSIRASYLSLPAGTPVELNLVTGSGDQQRSSHWGDYSSLTVDPVDGCTFWYVNEYYGGERGKGGIAWRTKIVNFKVPSCQ